jgi:hypothetical protein
LSLLLLKVEKVAEMKIPVRYIPSNLSRKDRKRQAAMLRRSRRLYKQGKYFTRKPVPSFHSHVSPHVVKAMRQYGVKKIVPGAELARKTGCSVHALKAIVRKGEGAYFSSGSRPNQTGRSWGVARLASALTAGKAAAVDYAILERGCKPGSKGLRSAESAKRKFGQGHGATRKTRL